jgi:3-hydroxyacyl-CoA dehydrogenase/enoyl-CoA hydratase/3-hydroxybutyryl-CoA epimerase
VSYSEITFEIKEKIAYIGFGKFEKKSMTTFTTNSLQELDHALDETHSLVAKKEVDGLILFSHKPGVFLAGMDVSIINSLNSVEQAVEGCESGQKIFNKIEDLTVPTAALVDGVCLGGGLEMSLACDKIIASTNPKTKIGLPEVMLGVLPGFGGTYRLPRKVGLTTALDMILTGKQVPGKKAFKIGLADHLMPAERLLEKAPEYLFKKKVNKDSGLRETIENVAIDNFIARKIIFQKAREKVLATTKGFYPAPLKILDVLESGASKKRASYLAMEANAFGELSQTTQSKSLQHIFFLTDQSKKMSDKQKKQTKEIKRGAVLGAGTMGGGIAWLFAKNGQAPIMKDINQQGLELGFKQASSILAKDYKRRKITKEELHRTLRSIVPTTGYHGFKKVDLVIEAIIEDMGIKKKVFSELEKEVAEDAIVTSNTSSLSVEEMATALEKPERFAGLHFFNPVNKMPLVEIIRHSKVSDETIDSLYKWALDSKKTPIIVNDGPGFLVNRILMPFINEAGYLLEEGVPVEDIDRAVLNFGMPMGPCRLMDEVGIDVLVKVGKIMNDGLGERAKPSELSAKIAELGFYGKKSSKGIYLYDGKGKQGDVNPEVASILPSKKVSMDETTIQMRVFLPMINEAASILQDGITKRASTVDIGLIYGIGFPPFKGGLLRYADSEGLDKIAEAIENFAQTVNKDRYQLSPFLKKLVDEKKKFYDV